LHDATHNYIDALMFRLIIMKKLPLLLLMLCLPAIAADEILVPTVEDNLRDMDKDRNGIVTVSEVRVFIESKHGKDYEKALLDKMEGASGQSCGTAFAQSLY
jgi:hypothetical protein